MIGHIVGMGRVGMGRIVGMGHCPIPTVVANRILRRRQIDSYNGDKSYLSIINTNYTNETEST